MGDWNEECLGNSTSNKFCDCFGLVDAWEVMNQDCPPFPTFGGGSKRIDFLLTTPVAISHIESFLYKTFRYRLKGGGDPRALYINIRIDDLFSIEASPQKLLSRGIISKDKFFVPIYLQAFHDHINANNVWGETKRLHQNTQPNHNLAEAIDRLLIKASQHAEIRCRRKHTNYWCLELHQHKQNLSILCPIRRWLKKGLSILGLIQIAKGKSIELPEPLTVGSVEACITKYKEQVNACHKESAEKRQEFLMSRENIAADADDTKLANVIKQIRKRERQNEAYKRMKFSRTASTSAQTIKRLEVPRNWPSSEEDYDSAILLQDPKKKSQINGWRTVNFPTEIAFLIQLQNKSHFGQAETENTPFTTPSMRTKFN